MVESHIVTGIQLCSEKFVDQDEKFKNILSLVWDAGFSECLEVSTRIYTELIKEFYLNVVCRDGLLVTKMKEVVLQMGAEEINHNMGFISHGLTSLNEVDSKEGLKFMGHKKNPQLKGLKKKEFPQEYEFLSEIVDKCIICKDSSWFGKWVAVEIYDSHYSEAKI